MANQLVKIEAQLAPTAQAQGQAALMAYLNNFKDSTLKTVKKNLAMVAELAQATRESGKRLLPGEPEQRVKAFDWSLVNVEFVKAIYRRAQNRKYSASTINGLLNVCRGVAKERKRLKQISADELSDIFEIGQKRGKRSQRVKKSKSITDEDFVRILRACLADEKTLRGLRDFTILTLLAGSGVRAAEAVSLRVSDVDFDAASIVVTGKGDNQRLVYLVEGVTDALRAWLARYTPQDGVLFPAFAPHADEPIKGRAGLPMSYQALYDIVRHRALEAGVSVPTPHWFRHTWATKTYMQTRDLLGVQKQLGHSDQRTTEGYIAIMAEDEAKRRAASSWKLPHV